MRNAPTIDARPCPPEGGADSPAFPSFTEQRLADEDERDSTMHRLSTALALAMLSLAPPAARADALKVLPEQVTLDGPHASQRLVVVATAKGEATADRTSGATFRTSDAKVATVDDKGVVRPAGDGTATITATAGQDSASIKVTVRKAKATEDWSFRNHVIPVLTRLGCNSGACHGALAGKGGLKLSLRGYDPAADHFAMTRQALGRRVDPHDPAHSLILLKPTRSVPHGGGRKLDKDSPDYRLFLDWIAAGAPGPRADDVAIERIEVSPRETVLKPGDKVQVLVRAWYSDGHSADVSHWSKYSSSEELVAGVDDEGRVTVPGHGEAASTVWYANQAAAARIVSPLPDPVKPQVFAQSPRKNFIDDLVLKKLELLRIPPSPDCTDHQFIRRAFLDAAGILPTPAETEAFAPDGKPDKRAR